MNSHGQKRTVFALFTLGLSLLAVIAACIVTFRYAFRAYDKFNDLRLDPLGTRQNEALARPIGRYATVLIGDSHAAGWPERGADILNLGIGGQTSTQIRIRSDAYAGNIGGDRLIIFAGANDLKSLLTNRGSNSEVVDGIIENISAIAENHRGGFARIYVMTVPPVFQLPLEYRPLYRNDIGHSLQEVNKRIRSLCNEDSSVSLVDAFSLLDSRKNRESLSADGIHLNARAYGYLRDEIGRIDSLFQANVKLPSSLVAFSNSVSKTITIWISGGYEIHHYAIPSSL